MEIAREQRNNVIIPYHLFLAITRQKEVPSKLSSSAGLDRERLRIEIDRILTEIRQSGELDRLLGTLHLCCWLLFDEADTVHQARLKRIVEIVMEYFC
jgi:hypothetical protein